MLRGVPISPGVAVARAFRVDETLARHDPAILDAAALSAEVTRFETACAAVAKDLDATVQRVGQQVGDREAEIFRSHRLLLRDPALIGKVTQRILHDHLDAASALRGTLAEYTALFQQIPDDYLRERLADVRDVVGRLLDHLTFPDRTACLAPNEPVILAAPEILPSQAVMFEKLPVAGIMTESGGATGHAAILARSLGIPAVSGLTGMLKDLHTGDLVALDGREGVVHLRPSPEVESAYRKLQREYFHLRDRLVANRDQAPVSKDGTKIELMANVNGVPDASAAVRVGAEAVGLYRTEFVFLMHHAVPTEEEQYAAYRAVIEAAPNRCVTIRTLDLGADKHVPYLGSVREANPFMGWRSIRLTNDYPDVFRTQLRAILRAAAHGNVQIMFPMVSVLEEITQLKECVTRAHAELKSQGIPTPDRVPLGAMIEVPGAALCIDAILPEVDFVSIGSNDLIQYLMAADRDNPKVAHLCDPFVPAIYRILNHVISACVAQNKPVTMCGEMAGRPRCVIALFGMGLRGFSMSPAFVPTVKEIIRKLDAATARRIADRVLQMKAVDEIKPYLTGEVLRLCPNVAMFDTFQ
jgi:phosphoenolpyruvate-protein phosphotransferase (PTS system enzyme I)